MHFDPYESPVAKRKRILSNILIVLMILSVFVAVVAVILRGRDTYVEPIYFDTVFVDSDSLNHEQINDFRLLQDSFKDGHTAKIDNQFSKDYSDAYKLIKMDNSLYHEDKPYKKVFGKDIVIAQCYPSVQADWRDLEVIIITVSSNSSSVSIDKLSMYKVKYNARSGDIVYEPFEYESFRLTIASIGISVPQAEINSARYSLTYKPGLDEDDIKENFLYQAVYDPDMSSYHQPKWKIENDEVLVTADIDSDEIDTQANTFKLDMKIERAFISYFKNLNIHYGTDEISKFSITIN